jgi:hypothetical protein
LILEQLLKISALVACVLHVCNTNVVQQVADMSMVIGLAFHVLGFWGALDWQQVIH